MAGLPCAAPPAAAAAPELAWLEVLLVVGEEEVEGLLSCSAACHTRSSKRWATGSSCTSPACKHMQACASLSARQLQSKKGRGQGKGIGRTEH